MGERAREADASGASGSSLDAYLSDVDRLCALVVEMVGEQPATLLSPVLRRVFLDAARQLQAQHARLRWRLRVDGAEGEG